MDSHTNPIMARCGRTDPHGAHKAVVGPYWCAGNVDIVSAVVSPMVARLQAGDTVHHAVTVAAPDTMRD